jgi:hypothetical protein
MPMSNTREYNLTDKAPLCPNCDKPLDNDAVAIDFVVCRPVGTPNGQSSIDRCGWCDLEYVARPNADKTKIIFKSRF